MTSEPRAVVGESYTFGGTLRTYTRQVVDSDSDDDAPVTEAVDAYEETGWRAIEETPAAIARFKEDVASSRFQSLVQHTRLPQQRGRLTNDIDMAHELRERHDTILRAMDEATRMKSLLSLDAFAYVPRDHVREFAREARAFVALLCPFLFVSDERYRLHRSETAWARELAALGATFVNGVTDTLDGHLRDLASHDTDYTPAMLASEHAHCVRGTTPLRVLSFKVPSLSLNGADDGGYHVVLVCHRVDADTLCFRTFYFARRAYTTTGA